MKETHALLVNGTVGISQLHTLLERVQRIPAHVPVTSRLVEDNVVLTIQQAGQTAAAHTVQDLLIQALPYIKRYAAEQADVPWDDVEPGDEMEGTKATLLYRRIEEALAL